MSRGPFMTAHDPEQTLLDHLVRAGQQRFRHREAECPRGLEVEYELELGRLLKR